MWFFSFLLFIFTSQSHLINAICFIVLLAYPRIERLFWFLQETVSVFFVALWHMLPNMYQASVGSKVCFCRLYVMCWLLPILPQLGKSFTAARKCSRHHETCMNQNHNQMVSELSLSSPSSLCDWLHAGLLLVTREQGFPPPTWIEIVALRWNNRYQGNTAWHSDHTNFWSQAAL